MISSEQWGYRLYLIGLSGRIVSSIEFSAQDDEAAKREAECIRRGRRAELWLEARRLEEFSGEPAI